MGRSRTHRFLDFKQTIDILLTIFARFGLPKQIVSDNAPNFTSDEFKNFVRSNAIKHITSAPYHPATNGIAERFVLWFPPYKIPSITLLENLQPSCSLAGAHASASIVLGHHCLRKSHKAKAIKSDTILKLEPVFSTQETMFSPATTELQTDGHGTITARNGPLSYSIQTSPGIVWRRHADQIVHTQPGATDLISFSPFLSRRTLLAANLQSRILLLFHHQLLPWLRRVPVPLI